MHFEGPGLLPGRTLVPISEAAPGLLSLGEPRQQLGALERASRRGPGSPLVTTWFPYPRVNVQPRSLARASETSVALGCGTGMLPRGQPTLGGGLHRQRRTRERVLWDLLKRAREQGPSQRDLNLGAPLLSGNRTAKRGSSISSIFIVRWPQDDKMKSVFRRWWPRKGAAGGAICPPDC